MLNIYKYSKQLPFYKVWKSWILVNLLYIQGVSKKRRQGFIQTLPLQIFNACWKQIQIWNPHYPSFPYHIHILPLFPIVRNHMTMNITLTLQYSVSQITEQCEYWYQKLSEPYQKLFECPLFCMWIHSPMCLFGLLDPILDAKA